MKPQPVIDVLGGDVTEEIFIRGNAERRRAVLPLNIKTAVGFDFGKITNVPSVSDDVAIAPDSAKAATGAGQNHSCEESDRRLIHN